MTNVSPAPGQRRYLARLDRLAAIKVRQAQQIRNADNTARGERAAGEADLDAAALRWAIHQLDLGQTQEPSAGGGQ